jgi:hypothetical protein
MAAILIFLGTYLVLAVGRLPGFRVDRTGAAIIGATLMVAFNVLTVSEAVDAINTDTILLLFGMMIVVANLRLSGFFALVTDWVVEHAHRPLVLLAAIVAVAGVFSAFFVNDTMCLVLTPLVLDITTHLKRNPVPYLLAVAMASNVGSVATITGNPQNMLVASFSGIHYRTFAAAMTPVALVGLFVVTGMIALVYRREFLVDAPRVTIERPPVRVHRTLAWKSTIASAAMIVLFFLGWPVAKVALVTGALLLVTRRIKPERVLPRDRLVLVGAFHRTVRCGSRRGEDIACVRPLRDRLAPAPGKRRSDERVRGRALEHREQRPGRARVPPIHPARGRSAACVADAGDVFDAGGKPDSSRLGGESHRDPAGATQGRYFVLGVCARGCAAHDPNYRYRRSAVMTPARHVAA